MRGANEWMDVAATSELQDTPKHTPTISRKQRRPLATHWPQKIPQTFVYGAFAGLLWNSLERLLVPRAGVEPAQPKPRDFKSLVSTNFTIGAARSTDAADGADFITKAADG